MLVSDRTLGVCCTSQKRVLTTKKRDRIMFQFLSPKILTHDKTTNQSEAAEELQCPAHQSELTQRPLVSSHSHSKTPPFWRIPPRCGVLTTLGRIS
jgi:hypothetical protein